MKNPRKNWLSPQVPLGRKTLETKDLLVTSAPPPSPSHVRSTIAPREKKTREEFNLLYVTNERIKRFCLSRFIFPVPGLPPRNTRERKVWWSWNIGRLIRCRSEAQHYDSKLSRTRVIINYLDSLTLRHPYKIHSSVGFVVPRERFATSLQNTVIKRAITIGV